MGNPQDGGLPILSSRKLSIRQSVQGRKTLAAPQSNASYSFSTDSIKVDVGSERPVYPLTSYGPGRGEANIITAQDLSPEELKLQFYAAKAANDPRLYPEQELYTKAWTAFDSVLNNVDQAYQFAVTNSSASNDDASPVKQASAEQSRPAGFGAFSSGSSSNNAFSGSSSVPSAFGQSGNVSAFGSGGSLGTSVFGSTGGKPSVFGAPKPANAFGSGSGGTSGFGSFSSGASGGTSAFGQTDFRTKPVSAFGTPTFGAPSTPSFGSTGTSAFGAPAFGQSASTTSFPAFGRPAFGQPAVPQGSSSTFGAASSSQAGAPSPFGTPANSVPAFGQSAFGAGGMAKPAGSTGAGFGAFAGAPAATPTFGVSAFGAGGTVPRNNVGAFGSNTTSEIGASAFSKAGTAPGPFGTIENKATGSVFGAGGTASNNSAFGQGAAAAPVMGNAFGVASNNAFGSAFNGQNNSGGPSGSAPFNSTAISSTNAFGSSPSFGSGGVTAFGQPSSGPASFATNFGGGSTVNSFTQSSEISDPYATIEEEREVSRKRSDEEMTVWKAATFQWGLIPLMAPPLGVR